MHFVTFCKHFFSPFLFQHITFIGIFASQIFYEIVLRATFNSGFGYIQLQMHSVLNAFLVHIFPLFDNNLIDGKLFFDIVCDSACQKSPFSA